MADRGIFIRNEESDYGDGFVVNVYNGGITLIAAREAQDGNVWDEWCYPRDKDKKPKDKAVPKGVRLGSPGMAVSMLKQAIAAINGEAPGAAGDGDPPF